MTPSYSALQMYCPSAISWEVFSGPWGNFQTLAIVNDQLSSAVNSDAMMIVHKENAAIIDIDYPQLSALAGRVGSDEGFIDYYQLANSATWSHRDQSAFITKSGASTPLMFAHVASENNFATLSDPEKSVLPFLIGSALRKSGDAGAFSFALSLDSLSYRLESPHAKAVLLSIEKFWQMKPSRSPHYVIVLAQDIGGYNALCKSAEQLFSREFAAQKEMIFNGALNVFDVKANVARFLRARPREFGEAVEQLRLNWNSTLTSGVLDEENKSLFKALKRVATYILEDTQHVTSSDVDLLVDIAWNRNERISTEAINILKEIFSDEHINEPLRQYVGHRLANVGSAIASRRSHEMRNNLRPIII